ncbi:hypothetical protein [Streptomyces sp. NPDC059349]|uniref:hypothetical protein n=1 Tax=Streptomyces sp. NPDC059349 TaxID=3346808 RepID=UPI0036CA09F4
MSKKTSPAEGTETVVYQSSLQLSTATLSFLGDLLRGHLKKIRSRWRKLPAGKFATIACGAPFAATVPVAVVRFWSGISCQGSVLSFQGEDGRGDWRHRWHPARRPAGARRACCNGRW